MLSRLKPIKHTQTTWTEVTALSPGYKPKTTTVWLGENAVTADFTLIPEASYGGKLLRSSCDCCYGQHC
ncbi:hypothetical protein HA466_0294560 [Hirschfeldia incana]|nr:hypothetical protein HA466_0294560 [Hirschfeldia incana]